MDDQDDSIAPGLDPADASGETRELQPGRNRSLDVVSAGALLGELEAWLLGRSPIVLAAWGSDAAEGRLKTWQLNDIEPTAVTGR